MKILHVNVIAGISNLLSVEQKRDKHISDVVVYGKPHAFGYGYDFYFPQKGYLNYGHFPNLRYVIDSIPLIAKYDIVHFHTSSLWNDGKDCLLWKLMGKKLVMHYHGSEIRENGEKSYHKKFTDVAIVSTPDLTEYSDRAIWVPNPINLDFYVPVIKAENEYINIFHSTTNFEAKGSIYVIEAINSLKKQGYKINFNLIDFYIPHKKNIEYMKKADIVIDQMLTGWYGVQAIEAMALKIPVCVYIKEELLKYLPYNPFFLVTKDNLIYKLKKLICEAELRNMLAVDARSFVENIHDIKIISKKVMNIYQSL